MRKESRLKNVDQEAEFKKVIHFRRIVSHVIQQRYGHRFASFELAKLEEMNKDLLKSDGISYSCHVS